MPGAFPATDCAASLGVTITRTTQTEHYMAKFRVRVEWIIEARDFADAARTLEQEEQPLLSARALEITLGTTFVPAEDK